jgi:hypothetical protein
MAYELKYTITQALRDGTSLVARIYEKDPAIPVVTVKTYDAINISLDSNASDDEPLAGIISSQLNISFLTTEEDGEAFPDLLSFDIRKYFVKLYNGDSLLWCGFLFNDYVQLPFTTGNVQVDVVAIDGLSFLEYSQFIYEEGLSINETNRLIDVIAETLNVINYPDPIELLTSCSYYAEGMFDRGDASGDEPFSQTYQYRRDFVGLSYYEVLDNIVRSFGCRLFQSDGKWQLLAINQMALTTRYFTNYVIYPTVSNAGSGTFDKNVNIAPYSIGNVHFVNNAQNKIVRKGYPKVIIKGDFKYADNYVHNGNFKGYYNRATPPTVIYWPYGWSYFISSAGSGGSANLTIEDDLSSNTLSVQNPIGVGTSAYIEMSQVSPPLDPYMYLPYMNGPSFNINFAYRIGIGGNKAKLLIMITNPTTGIIYYYNSSNNWQTAGTFIDITKVDNADYVDYSLKVILSSQNSPTGTALKGYVKLRFLVDGGTPFPQYESISIRSVSITQNYSTIRSVDVTRQVGTENTTVKEIDQPYGSYLNSFSVNNNVGNLVNASGLSYKNWYRYPDTTNVFELLPMLIARQYSNLLNKNFGTLEADLGAFKTSKGLNYLDKVYTVQDEATNALSYDDKTFLLNRGSVVPQIDEVGSFQLIEITNEDNDSVETVKYNIQ